MTEDCITATTRRTTTANTATPATAQANKSNETVVQQMYTVTNTELPHPQARFSWHNGTKVYQEPSYSIILPGSSVGHVDGVPGVKLKPQD